MASHAGPVGGHLIHIIPVALPVLGAAWLLLPDAVRALGRRARTTSADALPVTDAVRLTAAASVVAALIHLRVMPEHFRESWMYGTFFLGSALAQLGFTAWLLLRPSRALLRLGIGGNTAIVALWLVTRTVGVPLGPGQGQTEAVGALDVFCSACEAVLVVAALVALHPHWRLRGERRELAAR